MTSSGGLVQRCPRSTDSRFQTPPRSRKGVFSWSGEPLGAGVPGVSDLASALREHGVAELDILPGSTPDELMAFLYVVMRDAEKVRAQGGVGTVLASSGIEYIRTTDVKLTVIEEVVVALRSHYQAVALNSQSEVRA